MTKPLYLSIITPLATPGVVICPNAAFGDALVQVIDTVNGNDVTGSFDPVLPFVGAVMQLNSTPVRANAHLVVLRPNGAPPPTARLAVMTSRGSPPNTTGAVAAPGVVSGDVVLKAYYTLDEADGGPPVDCTMSFAPTAPANNVISQVSGVGTGFSIVVLLQRIGALPTDLMIALMVGMGVGQNSVVSDPHAIPSVVSGARILSAIDITNEVDRTTEYAAYASQDGSVDQVSSTIIATNRLLFLLQSPAP